MNLIGLVFLGIAVLACAAYGLVRFFGFDNTDGAQ